MRDNQIMMAAQKFRHTALPLLLCVVFLLSACAKPPFERRPMSPVARLNAGQLLENCWLVPGHRYLCHHTGLLQVPGRKIPLEGVIKIDTRNNSARLVAMDSMGVKLFDISVQGHEYQLNYLLPVLSRHKQLPRIIGASIEHIFLAPYPDVHDQLRRCDDSYMLRAPDSGARFRFSGDPARLAVKALENDQQHWRVDYYHYKNFAADVTQSLAHKLWAPTGIVLRDGAFSLTLWVEEIRELL